MKANQAFKANEEAVSPVIGVILMVAITVVLAAVVFVLVSSLGSGAESGPTISFTKDSAAKTLTVTAVSFDGPVKWSDLVVTGCTLSTTAGNVMAGQKLTACSGSVTITYTPTNSLVYETTF